MYKLENKSLRHETMNKTKPIRTTTQQQTNKQTNKQTHTHTQKQRTAGPSWNVCLTIASPWDTTLAKHCNIGNTTGPARAGPGRPSGRRAKRPPAPTQRDRPALRPSSPGQLGGRHTLKIQENLTSCTSLSEASRAQHPQAKFEASSGNAPREA